jgi:hypothetical protein
MTKEMNEMLDLYLQLNDEQRERIFSPEQIKILNTAYFYRKLFNDPSFYRAIEQAVGEMVYKTLRQED